MSRRNNQSRPSQSQDMWQNLLNTTIPSPGNSSTGSPQTSNPTPSNNMASGSGFANFANPYSQPFHQPQFYQPHFNHPPSQFYQPQFNQPTPQFNQPTPQSDFPSQFESEDEVEAAEVRKGKQPKRKITKWSDEEAVILAQRWISASENPSIGRCQTDAEFWKSIVNSYNGLVDEHRTKSQLQGKWNKIRCDVKLFGAIFKKYDGARRPSGADDKAVYDAAKAHFFDQNRRHFIYEGCWHELKDFPKFWNDYNVMTQQPSHQATQDPISLDDDEPAVNPTPNPDPTPNPGMASLFRDDPIRRPPGRGVSRKSQRSGSSSDAATSSRYSSDETRDRISHTQLMQQEALKSITEAARQTSLGEAFRVLNTPITEGLSKREKKILQKAKEKMMAQFQDVFAADDEDEDEDDEYFFFPINVIFF